MTRVRIRAEDVDRANRLLPELEMSIGATLFAQNRSYRGRQIPLTAIPDETDLRDRIYQPGLVSIADEVPIPDFLLPVGHFCKRCLHNGRCDSSAGELTESAVIRLEIERGKLIRSQGLEGTCTGQALAAVIDIQRLRRIFGRPTGCYQALISEQTRFESWRRDRVSARMLYEMARTYEFAPDSELQGSSIRNVLKAFQHNGVCTEKSSPYEEFDSSWTLSIERVREARSNNLAGYYRVPPNIDAWLAAINEVGALLVSAVIHDGWLNENLERGASVGDDSIYSQIPNRISSKSDKYDYLGGHAFAVVGYNQEGFYVLNSQGRNWGRHIDKKTFQVLPGVPGVALWPYDDWRRHVFDAWAFRLSHPVSGRTGRGAGWGRHISSLSGKKLGVSSRLHINCLLYTSPSPRDGLLSRMPSSA